MRNPPISSAEAAALRSILAKHGYASNPKKRRRKGASWKKRFSSKKAMLRHMAKMRRARR